VVYVGGSYQTNNWLRDWVHQAGGEFVVHAGLIDLGERGSRFVQQLVLADRVFCPLDITDPDSLTAVQQLCAEHQVPLSCLRTCGLASYAAALLVTDPVAAPLGWAPGRCRRHG